MIGEVRIIGGTHWTVDGHRQFPTLRRAPDLSLSKVTLAQGRPLTSLSDIALATSDRCRASGLAVRFQDLVLAFSPGASRLAFRTRPRRRPRKRTMLMCPHLPL
jgi:hypothetical protein